MLCPYCVAINGTIAGAAVITGNNVEGLEGFDLRDSSVMMYVEFAKRPAGQSDKISHIDMGDAHIDTVISHIISPYATSISRMTISIWCIILSTRHIPHR